jgi:hypothetical protein
MRRVLVRFWCGSLSPGLLIIRQPIANTQTRWDSNLQPDRYERKDTAYLVELLAVLVEFERIRRVLTRSWYANVRWPIAPRSGHIGTYSAAGWRKIGLL